MKKPEIIEDKTYKGMYRIHWPDEVVSDMVNLSRAKDAVNRWIESEKRRGKKDDKH